VRTNDDPIFESTRGARTPEALFFSGAKERRYLGPGESIEELMVEAGRQALADAGLEPGQVDRLYGYAFASEFATPNGLYKVHHGLGLRRTAMVVPVNCEFSNFITGLVLAWEAVAAGHITYAMVNCGSAVTGIVDYGTRLGFCIGDGAGAVIVGPSDRYRFKDHHTETLGDLFDAATLKVRIIERAGMRFMPLDGDGIPKPLYTLSQSGLKVIAEKSAEVPPRLVGELLGRNGVDPGEVAFIGYQGTRDVMDDWNRSIRPAEYKDTYEKYGNVSLASIPITLASCHLEISSKYIVLMSPGTGTHFAALLIER